jgi:hypothetical protein
MANYDLGIAVGGTNQQIADAIKGVVDAVVGGMSSSEIAEALTNGGIAMADIQAAVDSDIDSKWAAIQALVDSSLVFETKAAMDAYTPTADANGFYPIAKVWSDSAYSNGIYGYSGSAWVKSEYDPIQHINDTIENLAITNDADDNYEYMSNPQDDDIEIAFTDEDGNTPLIITKLAKVIIPLLKSSSATIDTLNVDNLIAENFTVPNSGLDAIDLGEYNYDFAVTDENGNVCIGVKDGEFLYYTADTDAELSYRDAANIAYSSALATVSDYSGEYPYASPIYDYNHFVVYGQSLSTGREGWPALSKESKYGNLMLGESVRPSNQDGSGFSAVTSDALYPLSANVQNDSGTILTDAEVALLSQGNGASGETVNFGLVNYSKRLHINRYLDTRPFITTCCGVSGKTIEQLSKINTQDSYDRYSRFTNAVSKVQTIADGESKTHGVVAIVWMQGEFNYANYGGSYDKTSYKTLMSQLYADMTTDVKAITGQSDNPVFITYQTGDSYSKDVDSNGDAGLHVGMAQWEVSEEVDWVVMAGPVYQYTDKGGHLDSNGYRWFGAQLAKVYNETVVKNKKWKPLSPLSITKDGLEIVIDFHVPCPPLVFDQTYWLNAENTSTAKGFRVTDDNGNVTISSSEIVGSTMVRLTLSGDIVGDGFVWYAPAYYGGRGNVRDSDPAVSEDVYEYLPDEGMYESANIPELINKPYPLHNWCVAFYLPIGWSK